MWGECLIGREEVVTGDSEHRAEARALISTWIGSLVLPSVDTRDAYTEEFSQLFLSQITAFARTAYAVSVSSGWRGGHGPDSSPTLSPVYSATLRGK